MGNILFFVQNTVSVDGQNSSSKFTVRVKVRADLQAAATEQTLSRSIPLAVRIAGLERISFQPQLCPLQCFKDHGTVYDQIFHQWEFAQRLQSNNASLTVPQKNGTGKTRQTIDPHGTGTALAYHAAEFPRNGGNDRSALFAQRAAVIQLVQHRSNRGVRTSLKGKLLPAGRSLRVFLPFDSDGVVHKSYRLSGMDSKLMAICCPFQCATVVLQ